MTRYPFGFKEFLETVADLELVALQHELRRFPEDRPYLDQVLAELARRVDELAEFARRLQEVPR